MAREGILIVGCGKQAEKHINGLRKAGLENIVLNDIDADRARALAKTSDLPWLENFEAALSDEGIVAVDICTPTPSHYPLAKASLSAKKHVFCEKPLCETSTQARELAQLARTNERACAVGFIYRFAPAFELLKDIVDGQGRGADKPLGEILCATLKVGGRGSHAAWKHTSATGGGAVNEMLVHMVDLAMWLFGKDGEVELLVKRLLRPTRMIGGEEIAADAEDYVVLKTDLGGVESLIEANLVTPAFLQQVLVQGSNGSFAGSIQKIMPNYMFLIDECGKFNAGMTELSFDDNDLFAKQMTDFAKTIRDPNHQSRSTAEDSVRLLELIENVRSATPHTNG